MAIVMLILWPSSGDCKATMNSALKSSQPSKTYHHLTSLTHSHSIQIHLFIFLSPVKQLRSHTLFPLLHIFQSPTFFFWNVFSRSRIFIKTCNNTDCSYPDHRWLSDLKVGVGIFRQTYERKTCEWKRTSSASPTPLHPEHNHPNTSLSWCYLSLGPLCNPSGRLPGRHGTTSSAISLSTKAAATRKRAHRILFINKFIHKWWDLSSVWERGADGGWRMEVKDVSFPVYLYTQMGFRRMLRGFCSHGGGWAEGLSASITVSAWS